MLCEVNRLACLLVRPPDDADPQEPVWGKLCQRTVCTFFVPPACADTWKQSSLSKHYRVIPWQHDWLPQVLGNIKIALEEGGSAPCESVYVTWRSSDIAEAINARVGTVLVGSTLNACWPDIFVPDGDSLLHVIDDTLKGNLCGHVGEVVTEFLAREACGWGRSYMPNVPFPAGFSLPIPVTVYATGRYFAAEDDRAKKHLLTQRILRGVKRGYSDDHLSLVLGCAISEIDEDLAFDLIVGVPPKPSKTTWGLGPILESGLRYADKEGWGRGSFQQRYNQDRLKCVRDYPSQKGLLSPMERRENVRDAFQARGVDGIRHALLVDDVFTSGATLAECTNTLLAAGVKKVSILVLGRDQKYARSNLHVLPCRKAGCDGMAVVRFRRRDGHPFWGCSNYGKGCRGSYEWSEGLRMLNRQNRIDEIEPLVYANINF